MSAEIQFKVESRDNERAFLLVKCANSKAGECRFGLSTKRKTDNITWLWDGNIDQPTIQPSISCLPCARHFSIIKGKVVL